MTDAWASLRANVALNLHGILSRIERRLDTSRSWGRDVDELFQQLNAATNAAWPDDAESSLTLALATLRLSFAWQARSTQPQRNLRLAAWFAALRLAESIEGIGDGDARFTDEIIAVWSGANVIPRRVLASILLDVASVRLLRSLEEHLTRDHMRLSSDAASLLTSLERYAPLQPDTRTALLGLCRPVRLSKGAFYCAPGEEPKEFGYVLHGLLRGYVGDDHGAEYNKVFFDEGTFPGSMVALLQMRESMSLITAQPP